MPSETTAALPGPTGTSTPPRVLFVCVPAQGHVAPLLPLALQFARAGAEVVVASGPDVAPSVASAGLRFEPVAAGFEHWYAALADRTTGTPGAGLAPEQVERYFVPRLFGEVGLAAMRTGLDALVGRFRPALVVYEPYALAAPLVAAQYGIRSVQQLIGLRPEPLVRELVRDAVTPAWADAGLPAPPATSGSNTILSICPPALDVPEPGAAVQLLRTTALPDPAVSLPVRLAQPDRPLVYVTLGTSFNEPTVFAEILRALADLPVTVLVTLGRNRSAAELGALPGNAVVTGFVPQEAVLPHCAAVVHHGGAGTALGVLAHGLPSVVVPRGADNFAFAARMADVGAARVVPPDAFTDAAVRVAAEATLADPTIRAAATRVAREIAAMPGPEDVVPVLLRQAAAHH